LGVILSAGGASPPQSKDLLFPYCAEIALRQRRALLLLFFLILNARTSRLSS
jgi:hypothetical protein